MKQNIFKIILSIFLFLPSFSISAEDNLSVLELIQKAQKSFEIALRSKGTERKFKALKAAELFKTALKKSGVDNGHLHFNIANAYFYARELGGSMLHYQKAKKILPNNKDIQHNLKALQKKISSPFQGDSEVDEKQVASLDNILFYFQYKLSPFTNKILFWIFFSIFCGSIIIGSFKKPHYLSLIKTLFLIFSFIQFLSINYSDLKDSFSQRAVITQDFSELKKGPGLVYENCFNENISQGVMFEILDSRGNWVKAEFQNEDVCWIEKSNFNLI